jgi:hypothetical protein
MNMNGSLSNELNNVHYVRKAKKYKLAKACGKNVLISACQAKSVP